MTKRLRKYNEIMEKYRAGEYGSENLTMDEILEKAGEPELLEKMNIYEICELCSNASEMLKQSFSIIRKQKEHKG